MKDKPGKLVHPLQGKQTPPKSDTTRSGKDINRDKYPAREYSKSDTTATISPKGNGHANEVTGLRKLFETQLRDLYWAEKNFTRTLPKMIQNTSSGELTDTLKQHLSITQDHLERCENVFALMNIPKEGKASVAMQGLIHEANDIMNITTPGSVRDAGIISAAQKVKHYEIASYGTLAAFARQLGEVKAVSLLEETLIEEKVADAILSEVAEHAVNKAAVNTL